jgi:hypothetical protein
LFLVAKYGVDRVITQKFGSVHNRHFKSVMRTLSFRSLARTKDVKVASYSKEKIDLVFGSFGAYTKDSRASAVTSVLTPLQKVIPPKRQV